MSTINTIALDTGIDSQFAPQLTKKKSTTQPEIHTQTVGDFTIVTYLSGTHTIVEDPWMFHELAQCYCDIFNESWGEDWTIETAKPLIRADLVPNGNKRPVAALLYHNDRIVGFTWGVMIDADATEEDRYMPSGLSAADKMKGVQVVQYWLKKILKKKPIFYV